MSDIKNGMKFAIIVELGQHNFINVTHRPQFKVRPYLTVGGVHKLRLQDEVGR